MWNSINFKQPKYIFPLIALPFVIIIGFQLSNLFTEEEQKEVQKEISTDLGNVENRLLNKNEAYDKFFNQQRDSRSMIQDIDREVDSLFMYSDNLDEYQKRFIDSLEYVRKNSNRQNSSNDGRKSLYYNPYNSHIGSNSGNKGYNSNNTLSGYNHNNYNDYDEDERDFQRSKDIINMLNGTYNNQNDTNKQQEKQEEKEERYDPVKAMREQMIFLDSIEKSRDPELRAKAEATERLKAKKEKMEKFLNTTEDVVKSSNVAGFNHISREKEGDFIKAIIDENIKGYLGSRIRIRILEDVYVGKKILKKGSFLYAEISGFTLQRVNLNIVSVMINSEIYPVNLGVYDTDGMKGLYVPASFYREMMREFGSNSVQGVSLEGGSGENFFMSVGSGLFKSVSETIASVIRKNKVNLKYNTYIYLINEKDLKKDE